MKYRAYRICLLSLVICAVIGGIFYYYNTKEQQAQRVDGTFVSAPSAAYEEAFVWVAEKGVGGDVG